ncbi:MAG: hypothetical protein ACYS7Y_27330 [Planctomycetota bacterium]|jgi:hypothetical protein
MPKTPVNSIVIPYRFVEVSQGWYSGIDDMLYAVSSTGNLTTGTIRPRGCDSDEKWYFTIWCDLATDVGIAANAASKGYNGPSDAADFEVLSEFEAWADCIVERLLDEYGLEDWDQYDG